MSIRFKLVSTISACALAFIVFVLVSRNTINTTKINGPWYMQISQGKDLVADILPPPEYIVEAQLIVYQMVMETDQAKLKDLAAKWKSVRDDYEKRHEFWAANLPAGKLKDELLTTSYRPAMKFFETTESQVIPALSRNDRETAKNAVQSLLKPLFEEHRASIEETVKMADEDAKRDEAKVNEIIGSRAILLTIIAFVILSAMLFCGLYMNQLSSAIIGRVSRATAFASAIAEGDMTQSLKSGQNDEIGKLIGALSSMQDSMREMIADVAGGVQTLASSSTELSVISEQMSSGVRDMSQKANTVAAAAEESSANTASVAAGMEQMTTNLASVASATEEMSATIGEIASNSEKARAISNEATQQAQSVSAMMKELGRAAQEIGQVTETITSISAQTNLLALNATIEAARAGAAGKGFAVVANEIKELAQQTAAATEDIKGKIANIQASTGGAIGDIDKISQVIKQVGEIVATIAVAIEEQSVVTRDVASNIAQATAGVKDSNERVVQTVTVSQSIARDIARVNETIGDISNGGEQVQSSSAELSRLAEQLKELVGRFRV